MPRPYPLDRPHAHSPRPTRASRGASAPEALGVVPLERRALRPQLRRQLERPRRAVLGRLPDGSRVHATLGTRPVPRRRDSRPLDAGASDRGCAPRRAQHRVGAMAEHAADVRTLRLA
jgi:hypothetical protein